MNGWWLNPNRLRYVLVESRRLGDNEINGALTLLASDTDPLWMSIMQLLEDRKLECVMNSAAGVHAQDQIATSSEIRAWEHLDAFQQELIQRRKKGLENR
jgi:hypothetical protein